MCIPSRAGLLFLLCIPSFAIAQQVPERPQLEVEAANQAIDKFETGLRKLLDELTQELDEGLAEQTKLAKLDEAIAVRDAKRLYEAAKTKPTTKLAQSTPTQPSRNWIELRRKRTFELRREHRLAYPARNDRSINIEQDDDGRTLWVVGAGFGVDDDVPHHRRLR